MKRKKNMKKAVSMLMLLVFLTGSIAGCGKEKATVSETEETVETVGTEESDVSGSSSSMVATTNAADNELSGSLKQKYAGSESNKYQWANPIYNVERDHEFVYEQVGTRYLEDDTMYDDVKVYIDNDFVHPIMPDIEYDADKETLTIKPVEGVTALNFISEDDSDEVDYETRDWGNAPKYWIVQYNDFATGEALPKPVVTLFTVKAGIDAPTVTFDVDEKGYARLSWKAVPGAESYRIYEMDDSKEYGISLESPYLVGETTETSFTEFEEKDEFYSEEEGATTQNMKFYDFGIKDEESGLSMVYCVVAVSGEKTSNVSNLIYQKDVRDRLVKSMVYDYEEVGEDEADYERVKEKVADLPAYQLVEMADTSIAPMAIDYANATWKENELGMADEGNLSIEVHAWIQGTDFKIVMYVTQATASTIDSDLAALAERQKSLTGKSADVKPQNDIDYVPSNDNSGDSKGQSDAKTETETEETTEVSDAEEADEIGDEELAETSDEEETGDEELAENSELFKLW